MASLFVLPFDHRGSFKRMILDHSGSLTDEEAQTLKDYKKTIFQGFKKVAEQRGVENLAILVDEEFGSAIHMEAKEMGVRNLLSIEKSGQDIFDFEYDDWQEHILDIRPTYAKALIRVEVGADNSVQNERLRELGDFCAENSIGFLIEPLIQPSENDLQQVENDRKQFDTNLRPQRFAEAVAELHAAGVRPDVWKIEGTETKEAMDLCSAAVFDGGKSDVQIVILGRGESMEKVEHWLTVSAQSKGVTGFAVGRTIFAEALLKMKNGEYNAEEAATEIADLYQHFIVLFETAQKQ